MKKTQKYRKYRGAIKTSKASFEFLVVSPGIASALRNLGPMLEELEGGLLSLAIHPVEEEKAQAVEEGFLSGSLFKKTPEKEWQN